MSEKSSLIQNDSDNEDEIDKPELSNIQAGMHVFKSNMGIGILTLPVALKYSGYGFGMGLIVGLSICAIYCMRCLLEISAHLRSIHPEYIHNLDFEKVVKLCFLNADEKFKKFIWIKYVLYISFIITSIGTLAIYHLFVSENTKAFVDFFIEDSNHIIGLWLYILIFFVLFTPLVFIKTLEKMAYASQFANLLVIVSLVISVVYCFQDPKPISTLSVANFNFNTMLAFGLIIFSFESTNIINPIENEMKDKSTMLTSFGVLNISTGFVVIFYMLVAFAGYWKFGDTIQSSLILSIPLKPWYNLIIKPLYIVSIYVSYSLQAYVLINIIWKKTKLINISSDCMKVFLNTILRISVPISSALLSLLVPHLDLFVSLTGALSGTMILLIIPSICHGVLVISNKDKFCWRIRLTLDVLLLLLGIFGGIIGTYISSVNIYRTF